MMDKEKQLIESGRIVNTHGVRGEVKIEPWADSPAFLAGFQTLYIDGRGYAVLRARVHKNAVIAQLEGVDTMEAAEALKTKRVFIARADAALPEGRYFVQDLIGLTAVDAQTGETLGRVTAILDLPAGSVAEIRGAREILVPVRPEFIPAHDDKTVTIRLIEGM